MVDVLDFKIEFDFESLVPSLLPEIAEAPTNTFGLGLFGKVDPKLRTVVCRHWLQGLCQKGDRCDYLHKMDKSKMPLCKNGKGCKIKNCPLKHEDEEEKAECIFFRQGFCMHGPECKFKHVKRSPEECPAVATFDQYVASCNAPLSKKRKTHQPNQYYKITLCKHWLEHGTCPFGDECHYAHGEADLKGIQTPETGILDDGHVYDPTRNRMEDQINIPFDTNRVSYFYLLAPDIRSLAMSRQRGIWSVTKKVASELSSAQRTSDNVILFFGIRVLKGIYGLAVLDRTINLTTPSHISQDFTDIQIRWLRTIRTPLKIVSQLKVGGGASGGVNIGRAVSDSRMVKSVGYEILLICLRKPIWNWYDEPDNAMSLIPSGFTQYLSADSIFPAGWVEHSLQQGGVLAETPVAPAVDDSFYKGSLSGFVFGCTPDTIAECFSRMIFGLPESRLAEAQQFIRPGTPLFLQDVKQGFIYGLYEADSFPAENIDPAAFTNNGTMACIYPVQVKFKVAINVPCLPAFDPDLMKIFGGRIPIQRIGRLELQNTKSLANLFASKAGLWTGPIFRSQAPPPVHMEAGPEGRQKPLIGMGIEGPFKAFDYSENVYVDIPFKGDGFHVRKRLLGPQASKVKAIIQELGSGQNVRIRLRGRGSGFRESNGEEMPDHMHFSVSTQTQDLLPKAVQKVKQMIDATRLECIGLSSR